MDHRHLGNLFKCRAGLKLRHKRSLYRSGWYVRLKIDYSYRVDLRLAYRISSPTYFEKNSDVHMKMGMCMCAA